MTLSARRTGTEQRISHARQTPGEASWSTSSEDEEVRPRHFTGSGHYHPRPKSASVSEHRPSWSTAGPLGSSAGHARRAGWTGRRQSLAPVEGACMVAAATNGASTHPARPHKMQRCALAYDRHCPSQTEAEMTESDAPHEYTSTDAWRSRRRRRRHHSAARDVVPSGRPFVADDADHERVLSEPENEWDIDREERRIRVPPRAASPFSFTFNYQMPFSNASPPFTFSQRPEAALAATRFSLEDEGIESPPLHIQKAHHDAFVTLGRKLKLDGMVFVDRMRELEKGDTQGPSSRSTEDPKAYLRRSETETTASGSAILPTSLTSTPGELRTRTPPSSAGSVIIDMEEIDRAATPTMPPDKVESRTVAAGAETAIGAMFEESGPGAQDARQEALEDLVRLFDPSEAGPSIKGSLPTRALDLDDYSEVMEWIAKTRPHLMAKTSEL